MIHVKIDDDKGTYELLRDEVILDVSIPKGFVWDGASSPVFATPIIPRAFKTLEASCLHDWLCRNAKNKEDRKEADKLFIEKLRLPRWKERLGYAGVRIGAFFGIGVYYKHWTDRFKKPREGV